MILVTGGAGFIGGNFVLNWLSNSASEGIVNLDKLTYAGNLATLDSLKDDQRHVFVHGDIGNQDLVAKLLKKYQPRAIINFAAESHVDRSISGPSDFVQTNVVGTQVLLDAVRKNPKVRFVHVSTDEVYGSIDNGSWDESYPLVPNSPYSASKASSDLLALAYARTYDLDIVVTRCCNNYGPNQFPEKLIPFFVKCIIENKNLPIYGSGLQVRDWIHVEDHCRAIWLTFLKGSPGNIYNFGGNREIRNIDLAQKIINLAGSKVEIEYVEDRKGHDFRYSVNDQKARNELNFATEIDFEVGLLDTISWYLSNKSWIETTNKYKAENRS
jgi:dTDP-glucose 4,6-dehydratase